MTTGHTVGFHNFNLRIFNLRVSNPNKLIVDVFLTRCRISMCQDLGPKKHDEISEIDRRLFCKGLLCFNTMPCRHMRLLVHFSLAPTSMNTQFEDPEPPRLNKVIRAPPQTHLSLSLYIYIYMYMYIYIYIYIYTHTHTLMHFRKAPWRRRPSRGAACPRSRPSKAPPRLACVHVRVYTYIYIYIHTHYI